MSAKVYGRIYLIRNKVNGKVYAGKTTQTVKIRWCQHCSVSKNRSRSALHNAIQKHGRNAFDVIELGTAFSQDELNEMEKRAIWMTEGMDRAVGYNLKTGGEGGILCEASRRKMSASLTGKKASEETRRKMSERRKAKPRVISDAARERMRLLNQGAGNPAYGKARSEQSRLKQGIAITGSKNHMFGKQLSNEAKQKMIASKKLRRQQSINARQNSFWGESY